MHTYMYMCMCVCIYIYISGVPQRCPYFGARNGTERPVSACKIAINDKVIQTIYKQVTTTVNKHNKELNNGGYGG